MGLKRDRPTAMNALSSLLLFAGTASASDSSAQRLAVVVPAHAGDLSRAVSALDRWPQACSPVTQDNVDLVLYYAEGEDDDGPSAALDGITASAGRCFSNTRLVYANLNEEEDVYPKGPSVQFYKMFLDEGIKAELEEYDALAIIEWDVLVASDKSFAELYRAAFSNSEDFWVKGSNLEGTNFHTVAESSEMWHVMGHINGNAIYNNNDPAFTEFVEYTLARWEYKYPYDVALWATISDFPYSWPLWQHYSSKFVTTNLISNVGYEHVDSKTVSDAVAGKTLFIHGSSVDNGNLAVLQATSSSASSPVGEDAVLCESPCGAGGGNDDDALLPPGTSTMCDPTCFADDGSGGRFGGYLCGAGNSDWFGAMCRICYTDIAEARNAESHLAPGLHVVMCDTRRPPAALDCSDECGLKKDTVCDEACGTGVHGDYNCNWRGLGDKCRFCFDDVETALSADEVAKRHGGRVIMCDTHEPPLATVDADLVAPAATSRRLTAVSSDSEDEEVPKWKRIQRWKSLNKWQTNEKWKKNRCDEGCVRTSFNGKKGRVCDSTCNGGDPYGRLGCGAKNNKYGRYCRTCFNDVALAMEADTPEHRAIMCDTVEPVSAYGHRQLSVPDATRNLTGDESEDSTESEEEVPKWKRVQRWKSLNKWQTNEKWKKNRCDEGCVRTSFNGKKGRVCDSTCNGGDPYGRLGCGAKNNKYGRYCRTCFNDMALAMEADTPEHRAIMCDTVEPVSAYGHRQLSVPDATRNLTGDESEDSTESEEEVPKWKRNQRWKSLNKWQTNEKWKKNRCDEGCVRTSFNGKKGRVCDSTCNGGDPYGRLGCGAKNNKYGRYCRTCFNDMALAMEADTPEHRAIMCDTVKPVSAYGGRRLAAAEADSSEDSEDEVAGETDFDAFMRRSADQAFTKDTKRGEICAFIEGRADQVLQTDVTVQSVLEFLPGLRVAVAVEPESLEAYERTIGFYTGVRVSSTPDAHLSPLFADQHCGEGTKLILYVQAGSVLSRTFSSKDTHTPRGELLVVYGSARQSYRDAQIAHETAAVLGFDAPSFTYGTDLILPVGANAELRAELSTGEEEVAGLWREFGGLTSVPQLLAALAYSRDTEGVHFVDPQTWVTQNLFKFSSIWDIPLMKPRFACALPNPAPAALEDDAARAEVLERSLKFFRMGGACENGLVSL